MSVNENSFINLKNASHTITADVDIPEGGAASCSIRARQVRRLELLSEGWQADQYNFLGLERHTVAADTPLPPGKATVQYEF